MQHDPQQQPPPASLTTTEPAAPASQPPKTEESKKWYETKFVLRSLMSGIGVLCLGLVLTTMVPGCIDTSSAVASFDRFTAEVRQARDVMNEVSTTFERESAGVNKNWAETNVVLKNLPGEAHGQTAKLLQVELQMLLDQTVMNAQGQTIELTRYLEKRFLAYVHRIVEVLDDSIKKLEAERQKTRPSMEVIREVTKAISEVDIPMQPHITMMTPNTLRGSWDYAGNQCRLPSGNTVILGGWSYDRPDKIVVPISIQVVNRQEESRLLPTAAYTVAQSSNVKLVIQFNEQEFARQIKPNDTKLRFVVGEGFPRELPLDYSGGHAPPLPADETYTSLEVEVKPIGNTDVRVSDDAFGFRLTASDKEIAAGSLSSSSELTQRFEPWHEAFDRFVTGLKRADTFRFETEGGDAKRFKAVWQSEKYFSSFGSSMMWPKDELMKRGSFHHFDLDKPTLAKWWAIRDTYSERHTAKLVNGTPVEQQAVAKLGPARPGRTFGERIIVKSAVKGTLELVRNTAVVGKPQFSVTVFGVTSAGTRIDLTARLPVESRRWTPTGTNDVMRIAFDY